MAHGRHSRPQPYSVIAAVTALAVLVVGAGSVLLVRMLVPEAPSGSSSGPVAGGTPGSGTSTAPVTSLTEAGSPGTQSLRPVAYPVLPGSSAEAARRIVHGVPAPPADTATGGRPGRPATSDGGPPPHPSSPPSQSPTHPPSHSPSDPPSSHPPPSPPPPPSSSPPAPPPSTPPAHPGGRPTCTTDTGGLFPPWAKGHPPVPFPGRGPCGPHP